MDQFKGIKRPPLRNTHSKLDTCPKHLNKTVSKKIQQAALTSGHSNLKSGTDELFKTPKTPSLKRRSPQDTDESNMQNSMSKLSNEEMSKLKFAYRWVFFLVFAPLLAMFLSSFSLPIMIGIAALGITGKTAVIGSVGLAIGLVFLTPLAISLKRFRSTLFSNSAKSHYSFIIKFYLVKIAIIATSLFLDYGLPAIMQSGVPYFIYLIGWLTTSIISFIFVVKLALGYISTTKGREYSGYMFLPNHLKEKSMVYSEAPQVKRLYFWMFCLFLSPLAMILILSISLPLIMGLSSAGLSNAFLTVVISVLVSAFIFITPLIIAAKRKNNFSFSDAARTHYEFIVHAYKVTLLLIVAALFIFGLLIFCLYVVNLYWLTMIVFVLALVNNTIYSITWLVFFVRHILGYRHASRNQPCSF